MEFSQDQLDTTVGEVGATVREAGVNFEPDTAPIPFSTWPEIRGALLLPDDQATEVRISGNDLGQIDRLRLTTNARVMVGFQARGSDGKVHARYAPGIPHVHDGSVVFKALLGKGDLRPGTRDEASAPVEDYTGTMLGKMAATHNPNAGTDQTDEGGLIVVNTAEVLHATLLAITPDDQVNGIHTVTHKLGGTGGQSAILAGTRAFDVKVGGDVRENNEKVFRPSEIDHIRIFEGHQTPFPFDGDVTSSAAVAIGAMGSLGKQLPSFGASAEVMAAEQVKEEAH